jgi:hypothetical protein
LRQIFSFQITPMDTAALRPQVSRALEKRTELLSRRKCPRMWELTDKLNSVEKVPQAVGENRRERRGFLGLLNWVLGVFLLMPGLMEPQKLIIPLVVGAAGFGTGVVILWKNKRTLLGILSLIMGVVLCGGALASLEELGGLLLLGAAGAVTGIAALLTRKEEKTDPFDRAAGKLLQGKDDPEGLEEARIAFSDDGMTMGREGEKEKRVFPYSSFEMVLETEDLILPVFNGSVSVLQKKDLLTGTVPELRQFLGGRTQYIRVEEQPEEPRKKAK